MSFCKECATRSKCIKICDKLEKYLRKREHGVGYSERHTARFINYVDPMILDSMAGGSAFKLKYGKKYNQVAEHEAHNEEAG